MLSSHVPRYADVGRLAPGRTHSRARSRPRLRPRPLGPLLASWLALAAVPGGARCRLAAAAAGPEDSAAAGAEDSQAAAVAAFPADAGEVPLRALAEEERRLWYVSNGESETSTRPRLELITPGEVERAQKDWGKGFLELSILCQKDKKDQEGARRAASDFVHRLYAFGLEETVLVRPPDALAKPFRSSADGVVASLVGGSAEFSEDQGFARLLPWKDVRFENAGISVEDGQALAMGNSFFVDDLGNETRLEYTFGYVRDFEDKRLRVNLHFSSVPFLNTTNRTQDPDIAPEDVDRAVKNWGNSVVSIGKRYTRRWDYQGRANRFLETAFAFEPAYGADGQLLRHHEPKTPPALFKPADAARPHFRLNFEDALSYFIGGNRERSEDTGFALRDWRTFQYKTAGIILHPRHAWAMGEYQFEDSGGWKVTGQFTMGLVRAKSPGEAEEDMSDIDPTEEEGPSLRIVVLHTSYHHDAAKLEDEEELLREVPEVTIQAVEEAEERWGRLLEQVSNGFRSSAQLVDNTFAYTYRPTLFKPTEGFEPPFRLTRDGAISYFAGDSSEFPADRGFATTEWKPARFENEAVVLRESHALAAGYVFFETEFGAQDRAEFVASFVPDLRGVLKFNMFHSAFPNATAKEAKALLTREAAEREEPIERSQIEHHQELWATALVKIGERHENTSEARVLARELVDDMYGFGEGPVLFKATETTAATRFRLTRLGVISYFAGGDPEYPADRGFARRPWVRVKFENQGLRVDGAMGTAMGEAIFRDPQGIEVTLEYTMNYFRDVDGRLRMNVHHLSIPYDARVNSTWDGVAAGIGGFAGGIGASASAFGRGVGSFGSHVSSGMKPTNILILVFVVLGLGSLAYFSHFWDGHAGSYMQQGGHLALAGVNFSHHEDHASPETPGAQGEYWDDPYGHDMYSPPHTGHSGAYGKQASTNYMQQAPGPAYHGGAVHGAAYGGHPATSYSAHGGHYGASMHGGYRPQGHRSYGDAPRMMAES